MGVSRRSWRRRSNDGADLNNGNMAAEFEDRGLSFVVRSTAEGIEQDLDPALDWRRFEQDLGRDYGPERGDHGPEH